ncbi:MAG TPA: hypothetical protein ACFYD2_03665 [Candidatus Avalokitesvara rifleensis]|uniref:hypothetical protein n=1 Tax=Candidatus Avalokitesvara rifleensis TaxID=3367620 RepID=UPI002713FA02|nr:hypothetical protein [Candidatus Brocadiales bacterium]
MRIYIIVLFTLTMLISLPAIGLAESYTDEEIANAIYKAEGGEKAEYLYGIRSAAYSDAADARRICLNTIRENRGRYEEYGHREYRTFLEFLASRYAPVSGEGLSEDAIKLNENWLRNVRYFLKKNRLK